MLVSNDSSGLGICAKLIEPEINREASDYIASHYDYLVKTIKSFDIRDEKAKDLLHDVFISVVEAENEGNGFNMMYGMNGESGEETNIMDVAQFVIGRIKLYARNCKYKTNVVEVGSTNRLEKTVYYEEVLNKDGTVQRNANGEVKKVKHVATNKVVVTISSNAASFTDGADLLDNNDDFQRAFSNASVADSTEDITEMLSLREQIDYCIDVCSLHKVQILNILKNIDTLANMLGEHSRRKTSAEGVFQDITNLLEYHTELGDTLMQILRFSSSNRAAFDTILEAY